MGNSEYRLNRQTCLGIQSALTFNLSTTQSATYTANRVGSGLVGSGWLESDREVFISRGSGRVGSGQDTSNFSRVGSSQRNRPGPTRPDPTREVCDLTREQSCCFFFRDLTTVR